MGLQGHEDLRFTPAELIAVRLLELHLVVTNATKAGAKHTQARKVRAAIVTMADAVDRSDVSTLLKSTRTLAWKTTAALDLVQPDVREHMVPFLGLEAYSVATPGESKKWVIDRETVLLAALHRLGDTADDGLEAIRLYRKSVKRLSGAAISPSLRLSLLGGGLAVTVLSGGLATAAGAFIGSTFLGFSGAAATSAGLAFLGGGSLAAGGFGMAGGTLLVVAAAKTGYLGAQKVAISLAQESSAALVVELAKIDVTVSLNPAMLQPTLKSLRTLDAELEAGPKSKESAKSQRAVKAEIRHLTDSKRQKLARQAHRVVPIPGVGRLIDDMG